MRSISRRKPSMIVPPPEYLLYNMRSARACDLCHRQIDELDSFSV